MLGKEIGLVDGDQIFTTEELAKTSRNKDHFQHPHSRIGKNLDGGPHVKSPCRPKSVFPPVCDSPEGLHGNLKWESGHDGLEASIHKGN